MTVFVCDDESSLLYSNHAGSRFSREEWGTCKRSSCVMVRLSIWTPCVPSLWRVSSAALLKGGRGLPGTEGASGEKGAAGSRGEKVRNQETTTFMCHVQPGIRLHDIFLLCLVAKGSSGSGPSAVGPKGEPGERVSSHWSHSPASLSTWHL